MNDPHDQGAATHELPEIIVTPDPPEEAPPASAGIEAPGDGVLSVEPPAAPPPAEILPAEEPPAEEPPIVRRDPFAYMRGAAWMDRRLSASGRAAYLLRRELDAFPVIEGRDPNHADLDAIVKRTVDYIAPILKREQATDAAYDELERQRQERIAKARATTMAPPVAAPGWPGGARAVADAAKALAGRAAAGLAAVPGAVLAPAVGAAVALWPRSPDDGMFELGEALRLRTPSGSLEGEIERRVGDRWEPLGIRAMLNGGQGARVLVDDAAGFARAVGADVAGRLAARGAIGVPIKGDWPDRPVPIEIRIAESAGVGAKSTVREASQADIERFCPNVPIYARIGQEALEKVRAETGLTVGPVVGTKTHKVIKDVGPLEFVEDRLKAMGLREMRQELALLHGEPSYRKGHRKIDVVEFYNNDTVCIIDFKTGGATFGPSQMKGYIEQVIWHLEFKGLGYKHIYAVPIHLP